ncbi:dephospho-CoA kinase [Clostridium gasigenes]|uniref:Dephospho-CoA kinase n=1 Tax=Clostridium gasigenes TaxID=94869 RepID=A0A7X0S9W6_9CLOT|nr:dephospho-CoA kinase [Clostridium gasigenes]MBB6713694.1 dephospho-CoA kinase [Clostridium gasigenes]MBU3102606.1 dephospho-CoA kinase [Clostridium gasigenes]MBU3106329.1 dephospho-CoA kinase [Clostridium gasigenes]MBU3131217.1 dephospho-CoA kinase [Clostridium gasigenes]MBU3134737.1 dephospho-CoA kinase [Clostridium gasigenes]
MIKIGLTGGIGSGKSTVSKILKDNGFSIIDADIIAKDVLLNFPEILEKVKIEFGSGFFDWRGDFRRKEFGNHIFRFPKERKKYEAIIMPYIKKEIYEALNKEKKLKKKLVILDAPTLVENNLQDEMDYIIVVWVDNNTQVQRIKLRDRLSRDEAINRINSQLSLDTKKSFADMIIDNNKELVATKEQVDGLVDFLKKIC